MGISKTLAEVRQFRLGLLPATFGTDQLQFMDPDDPPST